MTIKQYQARIDAWAQQFVVPYWPPLAIVARLAEETGELAREVNHRFGPKRKKAEEDTAEIADEIADMMFTLGCLANSQGIDLSDALERGLAKVEGRDTARFEKKKAAS